MKEDNRFSWPLLVMTLAFISLNFGSFAQEVSPSHIPKSIFKVFTFSQASDPRTPWRRHTPDSSSGSSFLIEGNYIITNAHVVTHARYVELKKQEEAKRYPAKVKFISHQCDLAILEVDDPAFHEGLTPLPLGGIPALDSKVKTIGFPMGGNKISVTNGVVSRIEKVIYSHTGVDEHLAIQTDAAINPGNSGGPVMQEGKIVGVAFQGIRSGDNIGYMIPVTVVNHFLKDVEDNKVNGVPEMGIYFTSLPPSIRSYLEFPRDKTGVLVIYCHRLSPAFKILQKNDIIVSINGHPVSDDGTTTLNGLSVAFYEVVERSQYGDPITLEWYRMGKKMSATFKLEDFVLPVDIGRTFSLDPHYIVYGGLVFIRLDGRYFRSFGEDWWEEMPPLYRKIYYYQYLMYDEQPRDCFWVLSSVLKAPSNIHAERFSHKVLDTINDQFINGPEDIIEAFSSNQGKFHKIKFLGEPVPLILSQKQTEEIHEKLLKDHLISNWKNFPTKESLK